MLKILSVEFHFMSLLLFFFPFHYALNKEVSTTNKRTLFIFYIYLSKYKINSHKNDFENCTILNISYTCVGCALITSLYKLYNGALLYGVKYNCNFLNFLLYS